MVESVGKKLHQARLQRGLTIDEAAHATKLRPDKISALENDDYSRFANNIYAKGFLQIYGRFLKVDVEDFARTLDNANPISIGDYQYLSNAPMPKSDPNPVRVEGHRRPPSLAPLLVFIFLVGGGLGAMWISQEWKRIQSDPQARTTAPGDTENVPQATPNPDAAFVSESALPSASPVPKAAPATPAGIPRAASTPALAAPATPGAMPPTAAVPPPGGSTPAPLAAGAPRASTPAPTLPGSTPAPAVNPAEQDFVTAAPVPGSENPARPSGTNVVLVATTKKTKVTVRKDDPKAPPIFEDYVYPNERPLTLKGARFFIEAADPSVVQITKNGLPFAYQANGGPVQ